MIQVATYSGKEAKYNGELVEQYSNELVNIVNDISNMVKFD